MVNSQCTHNTNAQAIREGEARDFYEYHPFVNYPTPAPSVALLSVYSAAATAAASPTPLHFVRSKLSEHKNTRMVIVVWGARGGFPVGSMVYVEFCWHRAVAGAQ